jgi:hypothetical protein
MFKVGDQVCFAPDIPRPSDWVEQRWRITELSVSWRPGSADVILARIQATDGTVMDGVDIRMLVAARRCGWWRRQG